VLGTEPIVRMTLPENAGSNPLKPQEQGADRPLPRLLYVADVPVEASYHGSALIYRLLQSYPSDDLLIVEQSFQKSLPARRLADVRYEEVSVRSGRLLTTRFAIDAAAWLMLTARFRERRIRNLLGHFRPQAVLTVLHGFSCLAAASFASRNKLPLHLIVHDDWVNLGRHLRSPARMWTEQKYAQIYRQAASRLCVSPRMITEYRHRFGADGTLLYPSRATTTPVFETPIDRQEFESHPFTVAYAGSLNVGDYIRQLVVISRMMPRVGGRLLLFGPFDKEVLANHGMNMDVVDYGGLVNSVELLSRLRREADVLFVPESFDDDSGMKLSFPSKLTDYTATAMPMLIWGPADSAAVMWAAGEPGVAAIVTERLDDAVGEMLERLSVDANWRRSLGRAAGVAGRKYFSPERAMSTFYSALRSNFTLT
jgi:glycosyltransferase involved in cell wall biosynthesis